MSEQKHIKTPKQENKLRNITIYGLLSFFGTERAVKCAMYLHKYLPHLYRKPTIHACYDYEWEIIVKRLREEYGSRYRRLNYLKHPVIVFFNDHYVGDHRAIIHYAIMEHRVLPDLPFPNLFPDFTEFLPKSEFKEHVYFDVRVGDLDDYVVGKMVFELHSDIVPKTCNFFKNLCKPFHEREFGMNEQRWKHSYLGSTMNRIYGNSFIQGGKVEGYHVRVKDENYNVKHCRRGVISLCNEGVNNSTTEFCISLKENQWLDGKIVAFGQLIFGEPILRAIQEMPTYYQRPLKQIIIVGCGVIPSEAERKGTHLKYKLDRQQEWINLDAEGLRKKRIEAVKTFEQKVKTFLDSSETEKKVEYTYSEDTIRGIHLGESIDEEMSAHKDERFGRSDFTLEELMKEERAKNAEDLNELMSRFIDSIVENIDYAASSDQTEPLDYVPKKLIRDAADVREVPSDHLVEERFAAGLYSIPEEIRKQLVKTFQRLTPSQLKMIGKKSREILKSGGVAESTASLMSCEDVMSGLVLAVVDFSSLRRKGEEEKAVHELFAEICDDTIEVLIQRGTDQPKATLGGSETAEHSDSNL